MPGFKKLQSQKRSQSQSKNGGRRRKHTMRKVRRMKKSRKVMRGGAKDISSERLAAQLNKDGVMSNFLERYFKVQGVEMDYPGFMDFEQHYNQRFNQNNNKMLGTFNSEELMQRLSLNEKQKDYVDNPITDKLKLSILSLVV